MYLHTGADHIVAERCQVALAESVFAHGRSLVDVSRVVRLIMHGIAAARQQDHVLHAQLGLLARVVKTGSTLLAQEELEVIKDVVFVQPSALRDIMMTPQSSCVVEGKIRIYKRSLKYTDVQSGIVVLLKSITKPTSPSDRKLLSGISDNWFNKFKTGSLTQNSAVVGPLHPRMSVCRTQPCLDCDGVYLDQILGVGAAL